MKTHPMTLVTIICEALAREPLKRTLAEIGAHGWTMFDVAGSGAQGERSGEIAEYGNIQVQVIVRPTVANQLLELLHHDYFPRFAMVAYTSEVQVLRQDKF